VDTDITKIDQHRSNGRCPFSTAQSKRSAQRCILKPPQWGALALLVSSCVYLPGLLAQEQKDELAPPRKMRMCIGPDACANLTWNQDHYDGRQDQATAVSSRYWITAWEKNHVELQGKTTMAMDGVFPAEGVFTGKISPQGDSLTDTVDEWRIGDSKSGTMSFTLTWVKSPSNVIANSDGAPSRAAPPSSRENTPPAACQTEDCQQFLRNILTTETATKVAGWRRECAGGWMPETIKKSRTQGVDMPDAVDVCLAILTRTAQDGDLLTPYQKGVGKAEAELYINVFTDTADKDTAPFQPTGDRNTMWEKATMTPSLVFDIAFTKAYRAQIAVPFDRVDMAQVRIKTSQCLEQQLSNSICSATGLVQGAYIYRQSIK
jgi:hypothetical protein